jgi:hypothetical protein
VRDGPGSSCDFAEAWYNICLAVQWYSGVVVGGLFVELAWLILLRAKKRVEGDDG